MKKVVVASLLAVAGVTGFAYSTVAQAQANSNDQQQAGVVQMSQAEAAAYNNAIGQTQPAAKAAALEAYLTAYPQSAVKGATLEQLMMAYYAVPDQAKTLDAADRLLQVDPNSFRALFIEAVLRQGAAAQVTDAAARQTALDASAGYAQKGLSAPKPQGLSDDDFTKLKAQVYPTLYSIIGNAAFNKKDYQTAITNFKQELAAVPVDATKVPGAPLQDTYFLASSYYSLTPPDLINCTWYGARAASLAPEPYKSQWMGVPKWCYKKYHGKDEGFDAVATAAQASLDPPADFKIAPAPSPADIVSQVIASTPDLGALAISDREFILTNGKPEDAAKAWDPVKGKSVQFPDVTVVSVSDTAIQVSVSDDAVQSKTADFTFQLKAPAKTPPAVGDKINISGTYTSFTPNPIMITMTDGEIVPKKAAPAAKAPVRRAPARH